MFNTSKFNSQNFECLSNSLNSFQISNYTSNFASVNSHLSHLFRIQPSCFLKHSGQFLLNFISIPHKICFFKLGDEAADREFLQGQIHLGSGKSHSFALPLRSCLHDPYSQLFLWSLLWQPSRWWHLELKHFFCK